MTIHILTDEQLEPMQRGFVRYINRQGRYAEEPAGLMGGVLQSPMLLFYHFFAIALYSMWLLISESPLSRLPLNIFRCVVIFAKAVALIWPFIVCEFLA
jgi:squalene monooxygenase